MAENHKSSMNLVIREQQLEAFSAVAEEEFQSRLLHHVREVFADKLDGADETVLRSRIAAAVETARGYEIVIERDVCHFVDLTFLFDPKFDKNPKLPWAREILTDATLPGWLKALQLWHRAGEEIAEAADE